MRRFSRRGAEAQRLFVAGFGLSIALTCACVAEMGTPMGSLYPESRVLTPADATTMSNSWTVAVANAKEIAKTNLTAYIDYLHSVALTNWGAAWALVQAQNLATSNSIPGTVGGIISTGNAATASAIAPGTSDRVLLDGAAAHTNRTDNPHGVTAAQIGALTNAWQNPASATNWTWTSDGTQITLTGYTGPNDVVIPDMLDNLPVTGFGTIFAFGSITSIRGGVNVTGIAELAFNQCSDLTSVRLLNVTSIGDTAFQQCYALTSVYFGQDAPAETLGVYLGTDNVTNYVTNPTATGWGATWCFHPVVRLPLFADSLTVGGTNLQTKLDGYLPTNGPASTLSGYSLGVPGLIGTSNATLQAQITSNTLEIAQSLPLSAGASKALTGALWVPLGINYSYPDDPGLPWTVQKDIVSGTDLSLWAPSNGHWYFRDTASYLFAASTADIASSNAPIIAAVNAIGETQEVDHAAIAANTPALIYDASGNGLTLASTNRWQEYSIYLTNNWTITISPAMTAGQRFDLAVAHSTSNQVMSWPAGIVCQTASTGVTFTNTTGFTDWYTITCRGTNATVGVTKTNLFKLAGVAQ